jgi:hypothetical protein
MPMNSDLRPQIPVTAPYLYSYRASVMPMSSDLHRRNPLTALYLYSQSQFDADEF